MDINNGNTTIRGSLITNKILFNIAAARNMLEISSEDVYNTTLGRNRQDRKYLNNPNTLNKPNWSFNT